MLKKRGQRLRLSFLPVITLNSRSIVNMVGFNVPLDTVLLIVAEKRDIKSRRRNIFNIDLSSTQ